MLIGAGIFVADTLTRLEIAVAVLYVAVILIAVRVFELKPQPGDNNLGDGEDRVAEGAAMQDYRVFVIGPDGHVRDRFEFW
jgi:hypothetical protein